MCKGLKLFYSPLNCLIMNVGVLEDYWTILCSSELLRERKGRVLC